MFSKSGICLALISFLLFWNSAQSQVIFSEVTKVKRERLNNYLNQLIDTSLAAPLNLQNEEQWMQTFYPLQLLQKRNAVIDSKISLAVRQISKHSIEFQLGLLELVYANYPHRFTNEITKYLQVVRNPEMFAIGVEYILRDDRSDNTRRWLLNLQRRLKKTSKENPLIDEAGIRIITRFRPIQKPAAFIQKDYLPGKVLLISFQRKNREYPGLSFIRDTTGNIAKDSNGHIFSVPQLARSISGLPFYIKNGNTPQGIYRMIGFDISKSTFIGPTPNIQMIMPLEKPASVFMSDSSYDDMKLSVLEYEKLLPVSLRHYETLYETFYASLWGRNEIISHGTTIDPELYARKSYYPYTPTLGCLCTRETWNDSGIRTYSDQEKLNNVIVKAGGPTGYVIVLDIDDQEKPVTIEEVEKLLNK